MDHDIIGFRADEEDLSNHSTLATPAVRSPFPDEQMIARLAVRVDFMHPLLQAMYDRHVAAVHDKLDHLAKLTQNRRATVDFNPPKIRFDFDMLWNAQIVGYEAARSSCWLWGWADHTNDLSQTHLAAVAQLRDFGRRKSIPALSNTLLAPGCVTPQVLCTLACGTAAASGYQRVEIQGGAVYVLISDDAFPPNIVDPIDRIAEIFPQVATQYQCNNRDALIAYARHYGLEPHPESNGIAIRDLSGRGVLALFDRLGRLVNMKLFD